jgi:hypothetical protein
MLIVIGRKRMMIETTYCYCHCYHLSSSCNFFLFSCVLSCDEICPFDYCLNTTMKRRKMTKRRS